MLDEHPAAAAPRRYYGKYPAVVVDNEAGEGAHLGKVKVRVFGILEEDEDGEPRPIEVVARPCFQAGCFFVPDRGTHVWVEFAAGDVDTPIWVGVWYADEEPPQTAAGRRPTAKQKVIRTEGEHVLTLDDDAGSIVIKDGHGNTITLEHGAITLSEADGAMLELKDGRAIVTSREPAESIRLGSSSASRGLLTDLADVMLYLQSHTHQGNMGAPTGPPLPAFTGTLSTWFTRKTKAE